MNNYGVVHALIAQQKQTRAAFPGVYLGLFLIVILAPLLYRGESSFATDLSALAILIYAECTPSLESYDEERNRSISERQHPKANL